PTPHTPHPMSFSKTEAKQLLQRLIFNDSHPQDWVQDVWGLSPTLGLNRMLSSRAIGQSTAKLLPRIHGLTVYATIRYIKLWFLES
ncbi:MAG: hypothetical protein SAK29_24770, partial [Scytonema sp. PMC 1069.18]|nr:hypothetical protein [Scytonema sp. PMC 1069.18]